jgi:uncharacterized NAD(P)/FAD-binding protein YdhS
VSTQKRIAILGGGPSGLFVYKRLVEAGRSDLSVDIFEAKGRLGVGMPYSPDGANVEHITNVSCDEIPQLVTPITDWIGQLDGAVLQRFGIDRESFSEHRVLPRLLFGQYLEAQFELLRQRAEGIGLSTIVHFNSPISDIIDAPDKGVVTVEIAGGQRHVFDHVVICTGHNWPRPHEGRVPGYFDSPYPPAKLAGRFDHSVAIRGSSLTAVDAIRTMARHNGVFAEDEHGRVHYRSDVEHFRIVMHSRHGVLPCVRFHLESPQVSSDALMSEDMIAANRAENDGFISLDYVFDVNFKQPLREKDPVFYERIRTMSIEQFVEAMLDMRERVDPFLFFKAEYAEAKASIRREESIYWKEMLATLSFAMNFPAKYMSAEDMLRLQHVLMPLIAIVIAFVPQSSAEDLIALHEAGRLELVSVGHDSHVEPGEERGAIVHYIDEAGKAVSAEYDTFVDCIGQPHLAIDDVPFPSLVEQGTVTPARLKFRSTAEGRATFAKQGKGIEKQGETGDYTLKVPGVAITDNFRVIGRDGQGNARLYMMAVPYMGGYNPDYSGLDFCEEASALIVGDMLGSR